MKFSPLSPWRSYKLGVFDYGTCGFANYLCIIVSPSHAERGNWMRTLNLHCQKVELRTRNVQNGSTGNLMILSRRMDVIELSAIIWVVEQQQRLPDVDTTFTGVFDIGGDVDCDFDLSWAVSWKK